MELTINRKIDDGNYAYNSSFLNSFSGEISRGMFPQCRFLIEMTSYNQTLSIEPKFHIEAFKRVLFFILILCCLVFREVHGYFIIFGLAVLSFFLPCIISEQYLLFRDGKEIGLFRERPYSFYPLPFL